MRRVVHCEDDGGRQTTVDADCILNATGRVPVVDGFGLEAAGVDFDRKGIKTSDQGRTNVPGHLGLRRRHRQAPAGSRGHARRASSP